VGASRVPASRRLRVTFTGFEPFWMQVLSEGLAKRHSFEIDSRWIRWPSTARERVAFVREMLTTDVAVRVGMPFEFSSETNRVWLTMVRRLPWLAGVNYWTGSDVQHYAERVRSGAAVARDREAALVLHHIAAHRNLSAELEDLGIHARTATVPSPDYEVPTPLPPLPAEFRVFSYMPDGPRFESYGGSALMTAAARLDGAQFDFVGGTGAGIERVPDNVRFHGWVDCMEEFFARSSVVVRLVQHDAVPGGTVEEGLVFGRHVIYSFHWPHTTFVEFGDAESLVSALQGMKAAHDAGRLELNTAGHDEMMAIWDADKRFALIRDALFDAAQTKRDGRSRGAGVSGGQKGPESA
jgi:hypothetical protein